jgi:ribosomal protein L37AE/L43A
MSEGRVVPFHCPYCAEEDLIPQEQPSGAWKCLACLRVFAVRFIGLGGLDEPAADAAADADEASEGDART